MARLINADALKAKANADPDSGEGFVWVQDIDEAPTVDADPVVHGTWEEWYPPIHMIFTGEEKLYRCSACTAKYPDVEGFRYCPFCGAMMDGGADCGKAD